MSSTKTQNDIVVLVHGLAGTPIDMWRVARALKRKGYTVHNCWYRTFGRGIESHAQWLGEKLKELDETATGRKIHVVTHSMGGIILRKTLAESEFQNIGRVVMLAPPHRGSHAARTLAPYLGWLTPSLLQLSDVGDSFVNQLPNSFERKGVEFGIVESTKDRVIAQGNVLLDGYQDYARVAGQHGFFAWYADTIRQVEAFLADGKFSESAQPSDYSQV